MRGGNELAVLVLTYVYYVSSVWHIYSGVQEQRGYMTCMIVYTQGFGLFWVEGICRWVNVVFSDYSVCFVGCWNNFRHRSHIMGIFRETTRLRGNGHIATILPRRVTYICVISFGLSIEFWMIRIFRLRPRY